MSFVIEPTTPVGTIARFFPDAIDVFESLDIDYACFGNRSLADAAATSGVDLDDALAMLAAGRSSDDQTEMSLPDLIHRIITEHHRIDRELMRDLVRRLGPRDQLDGEVARIGRLLSSLAQSLGPHMRREERELFPLAEELALHPHRIRVGSISRRLLNEFVEHGILHERIQKMRSCVLRLRVQGFHDKQLLDDLDAFEKMAHRHIHLETNVLAPRVLELENQLRADRAQLAQLPL
ncbi:MAG TPA: DUF542 domain-containing protein [Thermoanaerobaculia bacterium]|nr:DUF542 domain-containing protein [Thermoanaerobaculia bacterium]